MKRRFSVFVLLLIFISCIFTVNAETSDIAYADPITYKYGDLAGRVSHDHLLTSSAALYTRDESHSNWTASPCFYGKVSCDDTRYDDMFWGEVRTPFVYYNGYWYGISNDRNNDRNIIKANSDFTSKTSVCRIC